MANAHHSDQISTLAPLSQVSRMPLDDPADEALLDEEIRQWFTDRVRQQIQRGEYDIESRLDAALDRLAADLGIELEG